MSYKISAVDLSKLLGQKYPPTPQQAEVIEQPLTSVLVVAGAGAGKTETMAARVVWLVANGFVTPDQVLGLTFTRKAAQQLGHRIRTRLGELAQSPRLDEIDPTGQLAKNLAVITPKSSTYDAFVGEILREFGLLLPIDPGGRIISATELHQRALAIMTEFGGNLTSDKSATTVTSNMVELAGDLDNHMVDVGELRDDTEALIATFNEFEAEAGLNKDMRKYRDIQQLRMELVPLVAELKAQLAKENLVTFGEQTSQAAQLASRHRQVAAVMRNRYKVVLLDEYQDTSHAQRILLRSLFSRSAVTAVGDPMQSIYGWRGATSSNLQRFVTDYANPATGEPAVKKELTESFRNPPEVLTLANAVSTTVLGAPGSDTRPVSELAPFNKDAESHIQLGYFATQEEEIDFVADQLAEAFFEPREEGKPWTAAVLVRANKQSPLWAKALQDRGVPVEIVGLTGLVNLPEIKDLRALATMLVRPQDDAAAMRILGGPRMRLGLNDIRALSERAKRLRLRAEQAEDDPTDPLARLEKTAREQLSQEADTVVGLTDALADLGKPEYYSEEGYARLNWLSVKLRRLRTRSLAGGSLNDIMADIEREFDIRTEVLARDEPHRHATVGSVHLDRFAHEIATYSRIPGATLQGMLDYFTLAETYDRGLVPGEVQVRSERVQVLTAHKAKGLEWDIVACPHSDAGQYKGKADSWLTKVAMVPTTVRGDAQEDDHSDNLGGAPILDVSAAEDKNQFTKLVEAHREEHRTGSEEEQARVFYVAITRSERRLIVTASATRDGRPTVYAPYSNFQLLAHTLPSTVVSWYDPTTKETTDATPTSQEQPHAFYPPTFDTRGADHVRAALEDTPALNSNYEIFTTWEQEVTALIEEFHALKTAEVQVELGRELTASDLVQLHRNREEFARRQRRPIPFKPNRYAKRGTAFHSWLEDRFGVATLLDEDELPGSKEISTIELEVLKERFLASEWAHRTPEFVERGFEFTLGPVTLRGRMDAVFKEANNTWHIVDWKTGHMPNKAQLKDSHIQLAVYRLAFARQLGLDPATIKASFYYVAAGELISPTDMPDEAELLDMLTHT